jgi:hypothetical protein
VQGNRIGTNAEGDAAIPNSAQGLLVQSNGTLIGGSDEAANVISGNGTGITVGGDDTEISHNLLGTDLSGLVGLGNDGDGINLSGNRNVMAENVISDNGAAAPRGRGINMELGSEDNRVEPI